MTTPGGSRRKRILVWTAAILFVSASLYVVFEVVTSPFREGTLLGGKHPELIIGHGSHPKSPTILVIRDDLPSDCNCPLHQMLRGEEVVNIGWSRFVTQHGDSMEPGHLKANRYDGLDLAPARIIILRRKDATTFEADLLQFWDPRSTCRRLQDHLSGFMRRLIH